MARIAHTRRLLSLFLPIHSTKMKLYSNDLSFLDQPDYKEYKILKTQPCKPDRIKGAKGYASFCIRFLLTMGGNSIGNTWSVLSNPFVFYLILSGVSVGVYGTILGLWHYTTETLITYLWITFLISFAIGLVWASVDLVNSFRGKKKSSLLHGKQLNRLTSLEAKYLPQEEEIKKKIKTYVQQTSPHLGQKLLIFTRKGGTLNENEIEDFLENLNTYKENIEFINHAHLLVNCEEYLEHANSICKKAEQFLTISRQFIPSTKNSEKLEIEETHNLRDENGLNEKLHPKTEETDLGLPRLKSSNKAEKTEVATPELQTQSLNKNPASITEPIQKNEIARNTIEDTTSEVVKNAIIDAGNTVESTNPEAQLQLNFNSTKGLILTTSDPIKAKISAGKEITVKARILDWSKINLNKMEIGSLGEKLAFKFEEERLMNLGLGNLVNNVEHSSKVKGDGLGYDILSFDETMNSVFIEVKSTTGNFWNGIVFTKNEIEFMNSCGKAYRLYRIFEINKVAKTGKICTFSGSKAVNEFFNFVPQSFTAKPR